MDNLLVALVRIAQIQTSAMGFGQRKHPPNSNHVDWGGTGVECIAMCGDPAQGTSETVTMRKLFVPAVTHARAFTCRTRWKQMGVAWRTAAAASRQNTVAWLRGTSNGGPP